MIRGYQHVAFYISTYLLKPEMFKQLYDKKGYDSNGMNIGPWLLTTIRGHVHLLPSLYK